MSGFFGNPANVVVLIVIAALVAAVVRYLIKERRAGHMSCGGSCGGCSGCSGCAMAGKCHAGGDNARNA